jgi:DNA-binding protein HU-beta
MKKSELIARIAADTKLPRAAVEKTINSFVSTVGEVLQAGDKITLPGLGTFCVSMRGARRGRNPRTGQDIIIPAAKVPKLRVGKTLKEAVRG